MRFFVALCAAFALSALAVGQATPIHGYSGYGYGPYVPMVTTPEISLQTVSTTSPVGATSATGGLQAGATNSTLEMVTGNTSAVYTQPIWYSGGTTPFISSPSVQLPMQAHGPMMAPMMHMEHMEHERAEAAKTWTYFASEEETANAVEASAAAKTGKRAGRTYTNQDVEQENQKNGLVKYDGKTETIK